MKAWNTAAIVALSAIGVVAATAAAMAAGAGSPIETTQDTVTGWVVGSGLFVSTLGVASTIYGAALSGGGRPWMGGGLLGVCGGGAVSTSQEWLPTAIGGGAGLSLHDLVNVASSAGLF